MAHELSTRNNGFVEMAYAGDKPWHGLGQALDADASIEEWAQAAGMDWRIRRAFVRFATEAGAPHESMKVDEENVVLFRSDSSAKLAIVGKDFKVVQPHETLEFFRDLVESAGYKLCTAGVLKGGRKFWAQAECGMESEVGNGDRMKGKLLIATACDGSMKTVVKNVMERVVCANTLAIASKESGNEVKVSHKSRFNSEAVKAQLGIAIADFEAFIENARSLACVKVSRFDADAFLLPMLATPTMDIATQDGKDSVRGSASYKRVMSLFNGKAIGSDLLGCDGTAWGLVNAVTEFVDHHRGNAGTTRDNRLDYAWFGAGDALKTQAFSKAIEAFA